METPRTNTEKATTYPSKEIMELFLKIGKKLNIFGVEKSKKSNNIIYSNVTAVHALAILIEKINTDGNEEMEKEFKSILETEDNDKIFRYIANTVLDIWLEKHNCQFVLETIKRDKQRFKTITKFSRDDIVPIPYSYLPVRYGDTSSTNLIDEKFEAELERLEGVNKGANQIEAATKNHKFTRGFNPEDIEELKKDL